MKKMSISSLDLDNNLHITAYTKNFTVQTHIIEKDLITTPFAEALNLRQQDLIPLFNSLDISQISPLLVFSNSHKLSTDKAPKMFIYYLLVKRHANGYLIYCANWLNHIHHVRNSLDLNYLNLSTINTKSNNISQFFNRISEVAIFKAFYPLILYKTKKVNSTHMWALTKAFMHNGKFTKDYAQHTFSRLRTVIKYEFGYPEADIYEFIKDNNYCVIETNGEYYVPKTILKHGLIFKIQSDELLNYLLLNVIYRYQRK